MNRKGTHRKKKRRRSGEKLLWCLVGFFSALLIYYAIHSSLRPSSIGNSQKVQSTAAIVDHLSLTAPNQTFIHTSADMLKTVGFTVDYYKGEEVTVEFYRNLPTHCYDLIILRVHSALGPYLKPPLALFTSEPYSKAKYVYEQLTDQLVSVNFIEDQKPVEPSFFGITPEFIKHSMSGDFQKAIIIMMGCNGLTYTDMAEAFIEKGAKVYVSWSGSVLASYTDHAITTLLRHFVKEKRTLKESVQETFKELGGDPVYKSLLIYYPLEAQNYTIQAIATTPMKNILTIKTPKALQNNSAS